MQAQSGDGVGFEGEDGRTVLDDDLSTIDEEEANGQLLTPAQADAYRQAAKQQKWFTIFLLSFSFAVSVIVTTVRYYDNPSMAKQDNWNTLDARRDPNDRPSATKIPSDSHLASPSASPTTAATRRPSTSPSTAGPSARPSARLSVSPTTVSDLDGNGDTAEENASRLERTLDYLTQRDVSERSALAPKRITVYSSGINYTPQYLAARWIAEMDKLEIAIPTADGPSEEEYPFLQRYSLAVLFLSTGGIDDWNWKLNFLRGWHECMWVDGMNMPGYNGPLYFGVLCDGEPNVGNGEEYPQDGKRTVTGISLPPLNSMLGTLPSELRHLRYLKLLQVQHNVGLLGPIPSQYGWLRHLTQVDLVYNSLRGKIPRTFAQLTKLQVLRLEQNKLEGDTVEGDLDFLRELKDLFVLSLDYNSGIKGTIPDWISDLSRLKMLSFSNTGMYGTLPASLSMLTELKRLYLDDCAFEGSVDAVQAMTGLTHVYLEDNQFEDTVDDTFFADLEDLVHLDVSNCSFTGSVPGHLFGKSELAVLDMSNNNLEGVLPAKALLNVEQTKLEYLSLHSNGITGPIPTGIGTLKNLTLLDISMNKLSGDIPTEIGELADLSILFLGRNDYDPAPVPEWVRNLTLLSELSLKGSVLTDVIPSWLGELAGLKFLDLGENNLGDTIPESLGNLTDLMVLILNKNNLTGELGLGQLEKLETILIDDNDLTGDTGPMCKHKVTHFIADCAHNSPDGLDCPCCTLCCHDNNATCNDSEWLGNHKGIWEYGYDRVVWEFDEGDVSPLVNYNFLQAQQP